MGIPPDPATEEPDPEESDPAPTSPDPAPPSPEPGSSENRAIQHYLVRPSFGP